MSTTPRNLFSAAAAAVGVVLGVSAVIAVSIGGRSGAIVSVALWGALLAGLLWVEKQRPEAPEQTRRTARIGFGTSLLLSVFAVRPWFNSIDGEPGLGALALGALAVAAPSFIAAAVIAGGREQAEPDQGD